MKTRTTKKAINDFKFILFIVALMWGLEVANLVFNYQLNQFALIPRQPDRLFGIIGMHFLHWSIPHLIANTLPLVVLGFLICIDGKAPKVTFFIMLLTGILVWLFARNGVHAGASGLVLGYFGYLLSSAYFQRSIKNIILAVMTVLIYGGIVISLVDFRDSISFEGHIFGFLAGIISAGMWRRKVK